jgi:hypothetical protein
MAECAWRSTDNTAMEFKVTLLVPISEIRQGRGTQV